MRIWSVQEAVLFVVRYDIPASFSTPSDCRQRCNLMDLLNYEFKGVKRGYNVAL